ncbi:MAG: SPFH domain-containing protein [Candidatus Nanopelagicales bacterium]
MDNGSIISAVFAAIILVLAIITVAKAVRIVSQANAGIVERLGRYHRTLSPGLALVMPFIDRVLPLIDMREQVQPFQPQPVITSDNLVVNIDTVVYYQVTDPKAASYEIQNPIAAIEQITVTTLRNVIGSLDLEQTLTSRDHINSQLRATLDEATTKWGIRVNRVELKSIDPPPSVVEAMEKQMKAERDKRATILTAEGYRQSQILEAEGEKQSAILRAEGQKQSAILEAEGEATAIATVTTAVHTSDVDQRVLAYQYLQQLPTIANGTASKLWVLPAELTDAMRLVADGFSTPRRD